MNAAHDNDYLATHHPESSLLQPLPWLVFGHISFPNAISHSKDQGPRIRRIAGMMLALAKSCGLKPRKLVHFQNHEVKPESDYHHTHFLLGPQNLDKFTAEEICKTLSQLATEFELADCVFSPFDPKQDGVGYVTKRVFRTLKNGKREEIPPTFYLSAALQNLIKKKGPQ